MLFIGILVNESFHALVINMSQINRTEEQEREKKFESIFFDLLLRRKHMISYEVPSFGKHASAYQKTTRELKLKSRSGNSPIIVKRAVNKNDLNFSSAAPAAAAAPFNSIFYFTLLALPPFMLLLGIHSPHHVNMHNSPLHKIFKKAHST